MFQLIIDMDPLTLVRQATIAKASIENKDRFYIFGENRLPETTKTRFKRSLKGKNITENWYN